MIPQQTIEFFVYSLSFVMRAASAYDDGRSMVAGDWISRHWPKWVYRDLVIFALYHHALFELATHPVLLLNALSIQFSLHQVFYWIGEGENNRPGPKIPSPEWIFWTLAIAAGFLPVVSLALIWQAGFKHGDFLPHLIYTLVTLFAWCLVMFEERNKRFNH